MVHNPLNSREIYEEALSLTRMVGKPCREKTVTRREIVEADVGAMGAESTYDHLVYESTIKRKYPLKKSVNQCRF